jgi:hypothetical protein
MSISRPPPPKKEKSGLGCVGCGCLILLVILLVGVGLVGGAGYFGYKQVYAITSEAPATFPAASGNDDVFAGAEKKIDAFNQLVSTGNPGSLTLSADEINAILYHNIQASPKAQEFHPRFLVRLNGEEAQLQGSAQLDAVPTGLFKGRYLNFDVTSGITFNSDTKFIDFQFHQLQLGLINVPESSFPAMQANFSQSMNQKLREDKAIWNVLQVAKTVAIRDGQFVVETK